MVIDIISKSMLGHWDVSSSVSQCEYQFGQRLVFVQHPKGESHSSYIVKAQETVAVAWNDIENAVRFAEQLSRHLIPDFWRMHDKSGKLGARFDVYSIHYELNAPYPNYVIGMNHDFDFVCIVYAEEDLWKENPIATELPVPPDNFLISIKRIGENQFESAT